MTFKAIAYNSLFLSISIFFILIYSFSWPMCPFGIVRLKDITSNRIKMFHHRWTLRITVYCFSWTLSSKSIKWTQNMSNKYPKRSHQITWQQESSAQDRPLNDVLSIHVYIYVYQYRIKHCLTIRQVLKPHLHFLCFLTELILKNVIEICTN